MTDSSPSSFPNKQKIADRYILLDIVGEGSYSIVFRGYDIEEKRNVAIKELKSFGLTDEEANEAQMLFFNEINVLKKLHHISIPKVYDFFIFENRHYMVMQWIEGKSLLEILEKGETLTQWEAMDYMHKIAGALVYLQHKSNRIIYKDLKPSNILIDKYGNLWIIDFGTARFYSPEKKKDTHVLGTPGYAPPEAYTGVQTDLSADIYSLGATFYHLTTGQEPYQFNFNFPSPEKFNPELTPDFCKLLLNCLMPRGRRISDARKLMNHLVYIVTPIEIKVNRNKQGDGIGAEEPNRKYPIVEIYIRPLISIGLVLFFLPMAIFISLLQDTAQPYNFGMFLLFYIATFIVLLPGYYYFTKISGKKRDRYSWLIYSLVALGASFITNILVLLFLSKD